MTNPESLDVRARLDGDHRKIYDLLPPDLFALRDIAQTRAQLAELRKVEPLPEGVTTEDVMVPGPVGGPEVMVRLYRPATLAANTPVLYWMHGGGLVLGNVQMHDLRCANIADRLGVLVASVEYRLAPEHPYPAPLEDCYAGLRWLHGAADELGVDGDRIAIGGASAGGNLAAGLALLARDRGEVPVCFQLLIYPMLDDRNITPMSHAVTDPKVWNRQANLVGWNSYLEGRAGDDEVSPYAAPARATNLAGLPPAYLPVGDLDLFLDEDIEYARRLMAAGVPTELRVYPGAFHASDGMVPWAELSQRWAADEHAALARAWGL